MQPVKCALFVVLIAYCGSCFAVKENHKKNHYSQIKIEQKKLEMVQFKEFYRTYYELCNRKARIKERTKNKILENQNLDNKKQFSDKISTVRVNWPLLLAHIQNFVLKYMALTFINSGPMQQKISTAISQKNIIPKTELIGNSVALFVEEHKPPTELFELLRNKNITHFARKGDWWTEYPGNFLRFGDVLKGKKNSYVYKGYEIKRVINGRRIDEAARKYNLTGFIKAAEKYLVKSGESVVVFAKYYDYPTLSIKTNLTLSEVKKLDLFARISGYADWLCKGSSGAQNVLVRQEKKDNGEIRKQLIFIDTEDGSFSNYISVGLYKLFSQHCLFDLNDSKNNEVATWLADRIYYRYLKREPEWDNQHGKYYSDLLGLNWYPTILVNRSTGELYPVAKMVCYSNSECFKKDMNGNLLDNKPYYLDGSFPNIAKTTLYDPKDFTINGFNYKH